MRKALNTEKNYNFPALFSKRENLNQTIPSNLEEIRIQVTRDTFYKTKLNTV